MGPALRGTFWSLLGLNTCFVAANFWLATQGGDVRLPAPVEVEVEAKAAAVYGLVLVMPMFAFFLYVTSELLGPRHLSRLARLPYVFGVKLDRSRLQRRLGCAWVGLLLILPMAAVVHFENKMLKGTVIVSPSRQVTLAREGVVFNDAMCLSNAAPYGCIVSNSATTHLFRVAAVPPLLSGEYENAFQYDPNGCGELGGKCKGLTFFPFFEPWVLLLLGGALFVYWVLVVRRIVAQPRSAS